MSTKQAESVASLKQQITRLKKEIDQLKSTQPEQQASDLNTGINELVSSLSESVTNTNQQLGDEVTRLLRGYSNATAQFYTGVSDLANTTINELNQRTQRDTEGTVNDLNALPSHLYNTYLKAVNESAKIPAQVINTFNESYQGNNDSTDA